MAGSRLEKIGTIFTRVQNLLRAGVIKESEKPIWYEVYAAFPPHREPVYQKPRKYYGKIVDPVPEIFYREDKIRAKFYEVYGTGPRAFELNRPDFISLCQRFVEKYQELEKLGDIEEDRLFEETGKALLAEGVILRRKGITGQAQQQTSQATEGIDPILVMKLKDMLKEVQEEQQPANNPPELSESEQKTPAAE